MNSIDILVRGRGGHGSAPHTTKDPIVLASEIVLAVRAKAPWRAKSKPLSHWKSKTIPTKSIALPQFRRPP